LKNEKSEICGELKFDKKHFFISKKEIEM